MKKKGWLAIIVLLNNLSDILLIFSIGHDDALSLGIWEPLSQHRGLGRKLWVEREIGFG